VRPGGGPRSSPDRGSASIWILAAGLVLVSFAIVVVLTGSATIARHRAQTAADLGALAGAVDVAIDPGGACPAAAAVVGDNGATMVGCRVDGLDIVVKASVDVAGAPPGIGPAIAVARAGPIQTVAAAGPPAAGARAANLPGCQRAGGDSDGGGEIHGRDIRQRGQHRVQHPDGVRLGERLIAVAAFRRLYA